MSEKRQRGGTGQQFLKANKKIDISIFFSDIITEAKRLLADNGVIINVISLGLKESRKCITAFKNNSLYYRIGKTTPRKGKCRGVELLVMELIMDGNKSNVFIPLLKRRGGLENKLGVKIERANSMVEAAGKYRFKIIFPLENDNSEDRVHYYSKILANFIYHTRQELMLLNIR